MQVSSKHFSVDEDDIGSLQFGYFCLSDVLCCFFLCCLRLRNDLYCVEWGVKLYSRTHAHTHPMLSFWFV